MAFYSYLSTKIIIMTFITKSYQNLFGVRSYINAKISNMKNLKKYIIIAILASVIIYLSGCASLTYNPHSQTEKVKVTLKNK